MAGRINGVATGLRSPAADRHAARPCRRRRHHRRRRRPDHEPREGTQLLQFSQRYQQGVGPDHVHVPVYVGLGNHDLDQNGPRPHVDWYRREMRDYVEVNHRPERVLQAAGAGDELRRRHRLLFMGLGRPAPCPDAPLRRRHRPGANRSLPWLKQDLATYARTAGRSSCSSTMAGTSFRPNVGCRQKGRFDDDGTGAPTGGARRIGRSAGGA